MNHDYVDHRFTGGSEILVILAQPTVFVKPAEGALDDPPFRQDDKAFEAVGALDDLQTHRAISPPQCHPGFQHTRIGSIGPDATQPGAPMPQDTQQALGTITVLDTGGRNDHSNE